jgi:hypothetical protein
MHDFIYGLLYEFSEYGNESPPLFLFPLIGLLFESILSRRTTFWIIGISLLLLIPIFTLYSYDIPYAYGTLVLILASASFTIFLRKLGKLIIKVMFSVVAAGILFVVFLYLAFLESFSGSPRVERYWYTGKYKIEYIREQGFAGEPLLTYELSKRAFIPLLIRHIDTIVDRGTVDPCVLYFSKSKLSFNKCDGTLTEVINRK